MPRPAAYSLKSVRAASMSSSVVAWKTRFTGFTGFLKRHKQETGSLPSPVEKSLAARLGGERGTAPATAGSVRILEREAGAHDAAHVIDLDAVQILRAEHIDKHAYALLVNDEIPFARLLFNVQAVLKTRAPAGNHSHAEP